MKTGKRPSLERLAQLQDLIGQLSNQVRTNQLPTTGRFENDVEHSYSLALTAWFIADQIAPQLNRIKLFKYALAHDIAEAYAGDTPAFASSSRLALKKRLEAAAVKRLEREWPDFPDMIEAIEAYEQRQDAESKFVYALDKVLPVVMINVTERQIYWHRHKITSEKHRSIKSGKVDVAPEIAPYLEELFRYVLEEDFYKA